MSDTTPPASPEPTPYTAAPNSSAPLGGSPAGGAPAKAPVLSIISLIAGVVGLLGSVIAFIPLVGFVAILFPVAAVILGFMGKKKEPQAAKGLWLAGIILGFVGIAIVVIGIIAGFATIALFGTLDPSDFQNY